MSSLDYGHILRDTVISDDIKSKIRDLRSTVSTSLEAMKWRSLEGKKRYVIRNINGESFKERERWQLAVTSLHKDRFVGLEYYIEEDYILASWNASQKRPREQQDQTASKLQKTVAGDVSTSITAPIVVASD
jgi:hypothetical protein